MFGGTENDEEEAEVEKREEATGRWDEVRVREDKNLVYWSTAGVAGASRVF